MHRHLLLFGSVLLATTSLACNKGSVGTDDTGNTGDGGADGGGTGDGGTGDGGTGDGGTGWTTDCPALDVSETALVFPLTPFGGSQTMTVVLTNACTGEGDLDVTAALAGDDAFSGGLPTTTLAPGATAVVEIVFSGAEYGDFSATLDITSNDVDLPSVSLPVTGTVVADADGDGHDTVAAGGDDCDDTNPEVYPRENELARDLVDDDCDGTVDEDWIEQGDVIITEIMMNPVAVGDAYGEWFEVKNTSSELIDLGGWRLTSDDGDELTVDAGVRIDPGAVLVFGLTSDTTLNGGVPVDVEYTREDLSLADTADAIFVYVGDKAVSEVSYSAGWPITAGSSLSLDPYFGPDDNLTSPDLWCAATSEYGVGDQGTPGVDNDVCSNVDHDLDGYSPDQGDCDDFDATLNPGMSERWDDIDNNCDGDVDVAGPDDADNQLDGNDGDYLGGEQSLSIGDLDGDGTPDLVLGGQYVAGSISSMPGGVGALDGSGWEDWSGTWDGDTMVMVTGTGNYNYFGTMGLRQGDHDGDGVQDLVVVGSDTYSGASYGAPVAGTLFFGGGDLAGDLDASDGDIVFFGSSGAYYQGIRVESSLDYDGDGFDDIAYGNSTATVSRDYYTGIVSIVAGSDLEAGTDMDFESDFALRTWGDEAYARFGDSLGGGDLDDDGYDDLIVGASGYYYDSTTVGFVYVIPGGRSSLGGSGSVGLIATTRFEGAETDDRLGAGGSPLVADFDGDDELDLVLAAPDINTVYLFHGAGSLSGEVVASEADTTLVGEGPDKFGQALFAGDFDGDDLDDLVIGAPDTDTFNYASYYADEEGAAYLFRGGALSGELASSNADYTVISDTRDALGFNVNGADFDGDGTLELLVSAPGRNTDRGQVLLFDL
ncbi:lamin tail domain-containing protein [Myxococcota bacterium]|nr:lamin tail domain-containing protein [Myxococcota bacterium]